MSSSSSKAVSSTSSSSTGAPALAVLVFVHGFKGDDTTFHDYPQRLQHSLQESFGESSVVHAWVYPSFDTRGELSQCVENFGAWLTEKVAELEMEHHEKKKDGKEGAEGRAIKKDLARVVLIGHSMGGIVVADAARSIAKGYTVAGETRMWPRIVGVLAYDTPYLGVHPGTFRNSATEAWSYVQQAQTAASAVGAGWAYLNSAQSKASTKPLNNGKASTASKGTSSPGKGKQKAQNQDADDGMGLTRTLTEAGRAAAASGNAKKDGSWMSYGYAAAGATALAAAAGTAWYSRQKIAATAQNSQLWVTSHLEFVGVLWKQEALRERLEEVMDLEDYHLQFHCFFSLLPTEARTFIVLPSAATLPDSYIRANKHFSPSANAKASSEIEAHTAMFDTSFDAVYKLGQESVAMIGRWLSTDGRKSR